MWLSDFCFLQLHLGFTGPSVAVVVGGDNVDDNNIDDNNNGSVESLGRYCLLFSKKNQKF